MDCLFNADDPARVPSGYKAYLCVKPDFGAAGAEVLSKRRPVIWDILDDAPPASGIAAYITSTLAAAKHFGYLSNITVIPHHHCNLERLPSCGDPTRVCYIGSRHWYPALSDVQHTPYIVDGWTREQVACAYRNTGISINLRNTSGALDQFLTSAKDIKPDTQLHVKINSGMKLINCIGFGLPSVSADEPAYHEIAPSCTLFCDLGTVQQAVMQLQRNRDLYYELGRRCADLAPDYHVEEIIGKYKTFFRRL
jgi:hypothetical protein